MMERVDEEGQAQGSARGGTGPVRRVGAQRGQAAGQQGEQPQGRLGQTPQEDRSGTAQCVTAASWTAQEAVNLLVKFICARYGQLVIGWGDGSIRYRAANH
jgi:hypothetical protein